MDKIHKNARSRNIPAIFLYSHQLQTDMYKKQVSAGKSKRHRPNGEYFPRFDFHSRQISASYSRVLLIKKRVARLRLCAKDDNELLLFFISYRKVLTFAAELDLFTQNSSLYVYSASSHKNTLI